MSLRAPSRVRHPPRPFLMSALLMGAVLVLHEPMRRNILLILRFPFRVVTAGLATLVTLPRLPSLTRENGSLHSELIQRQLEVAQLREALRQAKQAAALLDASPFPQGVVARVMSRSLLPTQQTVLLDKGQRDGVTLESVIVDIGGVIGRVIEVHPTMCLVMLLTDPESRVAGIVERSRETGLLVGQGLGQCEFTYLDVHADIEEGDRIMTAGLGGSFPKGLVLGSIVHITRDEASGTAWALVKPLAHLGQLEEVLCLPPAGQVLDRTRNVRQAP